MLIKALYDYASCQEDTIPKGYCKQPIHFEVILSTSGKVVNIMDRKIPKETIIPSKKEGKPPKVKVTYEPTEYVFPERDRKPAISSELLEHRGIYIFGLNYEKDTLTVKDSTNKAKKSHESFVKRNGEFFKDLTSDICVAYYNFINTWNPELETQNEWLLKLGKDYKGASFCFGLEGHPEVLLHEDEQFKQKYQSCMQSNETEESLDVSRVCSITGEVLPIAKNHDKIKLSKGNSSGCILVCMDSSSSAFQSYGKLEAYNCNVSQKVMKVYTSTLNDLLAKDNHRILIDDMTIVYFAVKSNDDAECNLLTGLTQDMPDLLAEFTQCGEATTESKVSDTNDKLNKSIFKKLLTGTVTDLSTFNVDEDVTFYVFGLTPNNSRIAQKFIYKDIFGNIINNVVQHQRDIAMSKKSIEEEKPVTFRDIFKELVSPKSDNEKVSSPLMSAVTLSAFQGTAYPTALLENVVRRIKIDRDDKEKHNSYIKMNDVRVGIIKGYINRSLRLKGNKEEFQMSLDLENSNPAYLCGRLFAVCEKIQMEALGRDLNQTIKDSYFASACSSPVVVFPTILKLSQNHLANVKKRSPAGKDYSVIYQKLLSEIVDRLEGEFPSTLQLEDQGRFIIGYYQQNRDFFVSKKGNQPENAPTNEDENN